MAMDLTAFDAALKEYYTSDRVEDMVYKDNPLLAMLPKNGAIRRTQSADPDHLRKPAGTFGELRACAARGAFDELEGRSFLLTRVKDYSVATIDNETLKPLKATRTRSWKRRRLKSTARSIADPLAGRDCPVPRVTAKSV
jgi:hypothetical protein